MSFKNHTFIKKKIHFILQWLAVYLLILLSDLYQSEWEDKAKYYHQDKLGSNTI